MFLFLLLLIGFFVTGIVLRSSKPETRLFLAMFVAFIVAALYFMLERLI